MQLQASKFPEYGLDIDADTFSEEDFEAVSVTNVILAPNTKETVPAAAAKAAKNQQEPTASTSREQPLTNASSLPPELSDSNQDSSLQNIIASTPSDLPFIEPLMATESQSTSPSLLSKENFSNISLSELVAMASSDICKPSTSEGHITLSSIKPLSKATTQNRRKRSKQSIIATGSPFKSELENKEKDNKEQLDKKKVRLDLKQRLQTKR
ncbi:unnamed protein product [Euphydryas editha]|uniref:Uncharacterized protein n=1 Tax=Euphydryas editha TaxID=104508 RepID=A0AAU9U2T2_EUPED|nr:unnamed protein product [Euphydryas editha]